MHYRTEYTDLVGWRVLDDDDKQVCCFAHKEDSETITALLNGTDRDAAQADLYRDLATCIKISYAEFYPTSGYSDDRQAFLTICSELEYMRQEAARAQSECLRLAELLQLRNRPTEAITYEVDPNTMGPEATFYLRGSHLELIWMHDSNQTALFLHDDDPEEYVFDFTPAMLRELVALVSHPQFATALATVEASGQPALAVREAS